MTTENEVPDIFELTEQLEAANERAFRASEAHVITMGKLEQAISLLRSQSEVVSMFMPNLAKCYGIDFLKLNESQIAVGTFLLQHMRPEKDKT